MKNFVLCACITIIFASCGQNTAIFKNSTPEEKWTLMQEYMVPGAPVDNERPLPNVLSEREVLVKAAGYAIEEGVLDPEYYAYQDNPALMYAKIETPILITDAVTGEPYAYLLTAVDDTGVLLAAVAVNSAASTNEEFERGRGFGIPVTAGHYISKREAVELIKSQFPEGTASEPIAVNNLRLGTDPFSHIGVFWYFTVSENTRSVTDPCEEYIIAADIAGYRSIPGGVSNRSAIDLGQGGSPYLNGYRMAKLEEPLNIFDKLKAARSAGGASFTPPSYPLESIDFTPALLK
jgi:hypothetical protein